MLYYLERTLAGFAVALISAFALVRLHPKWKLHIALVIGIYLIICLAYLVLPSPESAGISYLGYSGAAIYAVCFVGLIVIDRIVLRSNFRMPVIHYGSRYVLLGYGARLLPIV